MLKVFYCSCLVLLLSSCFAVYSGHVTNSSTAITETDVTFVDVAYGYNVSRYFFAIGGLRKHAMIADAKRDLFQSYKLEDGQYFDNINLDVRSFNFWVFSKFEVLVSADVIQTNSNYKNTYLSSYGWLDDNRNPATNGLSKNDKILVFNNNKVRKGVILDTKNVSNNDIKIVYLSTNKNGNYKIYNVSFAEVFKVGFSDTLYTKESTILSVGSKVNFTMYDYNFNIVEDNNAKGHIVGSNKTHYLIRFLADDKTDKRHLRYYKVQKNHVKGVYKD